MPIQTINQPQASLGIIDKVLSIAKMDSVWNAILMMALCIVIPVSAVFACLRFRQVKNIDPQPVAPPHEDKQDKELTSDPLSAHNTILTALDTLTDVDSPTDIRHNDISKILSSIAETPCNKLNISDIYITKIAIFGLLNKLHSFAVLENLHAISEMPVWEEILNTKPIDIPKEVIDVAHQSTYKLLNDIHAHNHSGNPLVDRAEQNQSTTPEAKSPIDTMVNTTKVVDTAERMLVLIQMLCHVENMRRYITTASDMLIPVEIRDHPILSDMVDNDAFTTAPKALLAAADIIIQRQHNVIAAQFPLQKAHEEAKLIAMLNAKNSMTLQEFRQQYETPIAEEKQEPTEQPTENNSPRNMFSYLQGSKARALEELLAKHHERQIIDIDEENNTETSNNAENNEISEFSRSINMLQNQLSHNILMRSLLKDELTEDTSSNIEFQDLVKGFDSKLSQFKCECTKLLSEMQIAHNQHKNANKRTKHN